MTASPSSSSLPSRFKPYSRPQQERDTPPHLRARPVKHSGSTRPRSESPVLTITRSEPPVEAASSSLPAAIPVSVKSPSSRTSLPAVARAATLFDLPPLPAIHDTLLRTQAITHVSFTITRKDPFEENLEDFRLDYEKLALVGDAVLKSCLVGLINELYPRLSIGVFTHMMSLLVSNAFLAVISAAYGISERVLAVAASRDDVAAQIVTGGAMFESHLGALVYDGTEPAQIPLNLRSWSRQNRLSAEAWLRELFTPMIHWRYQVEKVGRQGSGSSASISKLKTITMTYSSRNPVTAIMTTTGIEVIDDSVHLEDSVADDTDFEQPPIDSELLEGAANWLHSHCSQKKKELVLRDDGRCGGSDHAPWYKMTCLIDGVERGWAVKLSKKDAKAEACARARLSMGL